jgi:rod shape-determining protein MreD
VRDPYTTHRLQAYVSALVALLLSAVSLPRMVELLRPDFLLLVVIWFALMSPRSTGLLYAFCWGLLLDAFSGVLLGEHALAFVAVAFFVHHFHLRMRMFPWLHQSLVVLLLLWIYQFLVFWIDGVSGHPVNSWLRLLPGIGGALSWPLVSAVLGRLVRRH